jgi:nitrite reductase/ring-hydroxylating ferredoxin subunit
MTHDDVASLPVSGQWTRAADLSALRPDRCTVVDVDGRRVLVVLSSDGVVHATQARCTHARVELGPGRLEGGLIECPMHGALFDPADGSVVKGPARRPVRTYAVRVVDGAVLIYLHELPDEPPRTGSAPTPFPDGGSGIGRTDRHRIRAPRKDAP